MYPTLGLVQVRAFLRRHPELTDNAFGRESCNQPGLISKMRQGNMPGDATIAKVTKWMEKYDAEHPTSDAA